MGSRCKACNSLATMESRARHLEKSRAYQAAWREENREELRARARAKQLALKTGTMNAYGGHCACCGEPHVAFLSIDHINNDGAARRREGQGHGRNFYKWLRDHDYPTGYQVLCFNCNFAKSNGGCPHQEKQQ